MNRKSAFFLLKIIACVFVCNPVVYAKEYRIKQNGIPLEKQLNEILSRTNNTPKAETIIVKFDGGYYDIDRPIEIMGGNNSFALVGSKNGKTIISGSVKVDEWEVLKDGLWRACVPKILGKDYIPDQLFVEGVRAPRARIPNKGSFILTDGLKKDSLYGAKLKKEDIGLLASFSKDEIPFLTLFRKWTSSKRYLKEISRKDSTLYFSGIDFPSYIKLEKGNGLILENTKGGIDKPGEWCVDKNGYIYYYPKDGDVFGVTEFRIPIVEVLLKIQSTNQLSLENLVFEHTTKQISKEGIEFVQAASSLSAAIEVDDVERLTIKNCEIRNIANYGFWFRRNCSESLVSKSYFHDLGAGAVKVGTLDNVKQNELTKNIVVENNIVKNYGQLQEGAVGILVLKASDCRIIHNDIHHGNYSGISLGWVWGFADSPTKNNEVSYNRISHIGSGFLNDLGGIYTVGRSEGTHVHHNVISNIISGDFRGWGVYADEGTTGVLFEKNLIYNCTSGGFHLHYGSENIVSNNIFAWGDKSQFTFTSTKGDNPLAFKHNIILMGKGALLSGGAVNSDKFVVGNNCYWSISNEIPKVGNTDVCNWILKIDTTSLYQDPLFRDPMNNDFRFKNRTVCNVIGFEPFDYSKAGVYGRKEWRKLAASL